MPASSYAAQKPEGVSRAGAYTAAGLVGGSTLIPLGMLGKAGKDIFKKKGGNWVSTIGSTVKRNPWTLLAAFGLASTAVKLASKDSVNSQIPMRKRVAALAQGLGTSTVATFTELGAAGFGASLVIAGKNAFKTNGKKILPALGTAFNRNPIGALACSGLVAVSVWLEKKTSHFQDKAITGKSSE